MTSPGFSTSSRPLIIGHRGVSGHRYENSLAAFRMAASPGPSHCDGVELDLHVGADGTLAVHHDPNLPSGRAIAELGRVEIAAERLPDGTTVPSLEEALEILHPLDVFIEAKGLPEWSDGTLLALIRRQPNPDRCHVHSFDHRIIARLGRKAPELSLGILSSSYPVDPVEQVSAAGAGILWQQCDLIDANLVDRCGEAHIGVIAWTVNDRRMAEHLSKLGVLGLCGNYPERLRGADR
jgi:glycerophosphoryl diester phosphodiesterase